jgi:hypothetical protein
VIIELLGQQIDLTPFAVFLMQLMVVQPMKEFPVILGQEESS